MKVITVIPMEKGGGRRSLSYFTTKEIGIGDIVEAPLRNKKILGLVVSLEDARDAKGSVKELGFSLKKVAEKKANTFFLKEFLNSAILIDKYFSFPSGNALPSLFPALLVQKHDRISDFHKHDIRTDDTEEKNIKPEKLLFQAPAEERISYYKTLIRGSFAQRKSVAVILPTENATETLFRSLSKGIENFSFVLHGGLSEKKVLERIEKIIALEHPVLIVSTAPYLAVPRSDLGALILEDEHSSAYRTITRPNIDLRTFVEVFAQKRNIKLIAADTLLRFETIGRKERDGWGEVMPLSFRTSFEGKIEIPEPEDPTVVKKKWRLFNDKNLSSIRSAIEKKKNVFIFSLRKGLATVTICRDCNETLLCKNCLAPVVLYISRDGKKRMFSCNRCHEEKDPRTICSKCGSWNLMPLGIGTDTVLEELKEIFGKEKKTVKIMKLDKESAKTGSGAEKIAKGFEEQSGAILVGTEMALFYLREKVPLSVIASFDALWSIPSFRMSEKVATLLVSILSVTKEKLVIQTKNQEDPAIVAVLEDNLLPFVRSELKDRQNLGYPPYRRFIKIKHLGAKEDVRKTKQVLGRIFEEYNPEIFSGFIAKIKNKYATNALLKIDPKRWSLSELSPGGSLDENLTQKLSALPPEFEISVDPEDLL